MKPVAMAEIAEALGLSKQAAQKRANKEMRENDALWQAEKCGRGLVYLIPTLPRDVREACQRLALKKAMTALPESAQQPETTQPAPLPTVTARPPATRQPIAAEAADAAQLLVRDARVSILNALAGAVGGHGMTAAKAITAWLAAIAEGAMPVAQLLWCCIAHDKNGFLWEVSYEGAGRRRCRVRGRKSANSPASCRSAPCSAGSRCA